MRIALISDVHGNTPGLRAVLNTLGDGSHVDITFCLGDMLGYGPGAEDVLDLLVSRGVRMLRGNHEDMYSDAKTLASHVHPNSRAYFQATSAWLHSRLLAEHWELLASLPYSEQVDLGEGRTLLACHSTPVSPWSFACGPGSSAELLEVAYGAVQADVIAFGHAHRGDGPDHYVRWWGAKLLVNVASVGARRDGLSGVTVLDVTKDEVLITQVQVPYDAAEERRLKAARLPPELQRP